MAQTRLSEKDPDGAFAALRKAIGMPGCSADDRLTAADLFAQVGSKAEAAAAYLQAGTSFLYDHSDIARARRAFAAAHDLDAQNLDVLFCMGQADVIEGRAQDALAKFIDVLRKSNLKHMPALFEAGCIYQANGQYDQAILAFKKLLDRDKVHLQAVMHIGQLHQSKGMLPEALSYFVRAAEISRDAAQYDTARQVLRKVLALDSSHQKARYLLDDIDEQATEAEAQAAAQTSVAEASTAAPARTQAEALAARSEHAKPSNGSGITSRTAEPFKTPTLVETSQAPGAPTPPELAETIIKAQAEFKALDERRQTMLQQIAAAQSEHASLEQMKQSALAALDGLHREHDSLQRTLETLAAECQEVAKNKALQEDADAELASKMQGARADLARLQRQTEALRAEAATAQQQRTDLEAKLAQLNELQKIAAEETRAQRSGVENLQLQRTALEKSLAQLREQLEEHAKMEAAKSSAVASLISRQQEAQATLDRQFAESQRISADLGATKGRVSDLRAEHDTLERSIAALREQVSGLVKERQLHETAIADLAGRRSHAESELAQFERRVESARSKAENADQDLRDVVEEARAAQTAATSAAARLAETRAELAALEAKRSEAEAAYGKLKALADETSSQLTRSRSSPGSPVATSAAPAAPAVGQAVEEGADDVARGDLALAEQDYQAAAAAYRRALEKNPYHPGASYQLACLLSDRFPDYVTAQQLLENAAAMRPEHAATQYRLAFIKAARGDVPQAIRGLIQLAGSDKSKAELLEQFVERLEKEAQGGSVDWRYRLGIAYRELGRIEEALVLLQSIQRETEYVVLCLNAIGQCLRRQGLDTAAAKRFRRAVETPGYPEVQYNEALYNLGDLHETKGDPESLMAALSSYEELYASDCTYKDVPDRIRSVKLKLGAADSPKVKRLPSRSSEAASDR